MGVSAKKFALQAQNGRKKLYSGMLGEFFRGTAAESPVLGEFFAEQPLKAPCWASFFAEVPGESH